MKSVVSGSIEAQPEAKLVIELVGGEPYEYYPLGDHIVGENPTINYNKRLCQLPSHHCLLGFKTRVGRRFRFNKRFGTPIYMAKVA